MNNKLDEQLGQLYRDIAELENKMRLLQAKHTEIIFSDPLTNIDYNSRSRLRDAKLTIALSEDHQYQTYLQQLIELKSKEASLEPETIE